MAHARHPTDVKRFAKSFYILATLFVIAAHASLAAAQSTCDHVIFHLADTAQTVDRGAICRAAEPWAGQGIQTFILLTDFAPDGQEAWYDYLDRAEAAMNIRDLGQQDAFNVNVLALEASTAGSQYTYITIGEALFGTPMDSETGRAPIISALQSGVVAGEPTEAFAAALSTAYALNRPATEPGSETIPEEAARRSPIATILPLAILLGALGLGAYYLYPRLLQPALAERRRQLPANPEPLTGTGAQWPALEEPLLDHSPTMTQAQLIGAVDALLAGKDLDETSMEEE